METNGLGRKEKQGKDPWDLLPWDSVEQVILVLKMGSVKYGARNWEKGLRVDELFAATIRHLVSWWGGQDRDPESGLPHLAHAITSLLFILAFYVRGMNSAQIDTRPGRAL